MLDVRRLLGWRMDGQAIWTFEGGSEGAPEGSGDGDDGDDDDEGGDGGGDGSKLERAIERERKAAREARDALRPWRSLAQELGVKSPSEIKNRLAAMTKEQEESAQERDRRDAEIITKANTRVIKASIKALAAKEFSDPEDAVLNLKVSDYEVNDDGDVDEKAIKRDLEALLKRKPHLGATSKKVNFEGGARKTAEGPPNMNDRIRAAARR